MTWAAVVVGGVGMAAGVGGALAAKSGQKKMGVFKPTPYSGMKPPEFKNLRPVEQQITDILMRRSQGQDVGYDPVRLKKMKENFDIDQEQRAEVGEADIINQLSGTGLSRNLAARDRLLGNYQRENERERNKAFNQYDISDLEAARADKNENTRNLQQWGEFGFGQENSRAQFDQNLWSAENGLNAQAVESQNAATQYQNQQKRQFVEDLTGSVGGGIQTGMNVYGMGQQDKLLKALMAQKGGVNLTK